MELPENIDDNILDAPTEEDLDEIYKCINLLSRCEHFVVDSEALILANAQEILRSFI